MKTELKNRTLWFDGTNEVDPSLVPEMFLLGIKPEKLVVTEEDDDIILFNQLSDELVRCGKVSNGDLDTEWNLPVEYLQLDLRAAIADRLQAYVERTTGLDSDRVEMYERRVQMEMAEITKRNLIPLFKALFYVVDRFRATSTVWGVGRGSSCACLVLFLMGLHMVDPVKYGIAHTEFFHD